MKRCKIEIALKARPRLSLLVAAAVTLSGAFFSARAQAERFANCCCPSDSCAFY